MTVAFTGHRDIAEKSAVSLKLRETLRMLIAEGADCFICGGAVGFDTLAAQTVLELKKEFNVQLWLAIPCADQDIWFSDEQRAEYARIRAAADRETVLSPRYSRGCMHARNRFMVDHCDVMVTYCRRISGGSAYTVSYAKQKKKKMIHL